MKKIVRPLLGLLTLVSLTLVTSQLSFAQGSWVIKDFRSQINIQKDGSVLISETISVDFGSLQKHGIFRDIPVIYQDKNGNKTYSQITITKVGRNQTQENYSISHPNNYLEIKIGNANKLVSGSQIYSINYLVKGVLLGYSSYDELYWNVTGNGWGVPIEKVESLVVLPSSGVLQSSCYQGVAGSVEKCTATGGNSSASLSSTRALAAGEGLTVAVGYKKGLAALITVAKPKTIWEKLLEPINLLAFTAALLVSCFLVIQVWYKKGRDFWTRRRFIDDPDSKVGVKPISAHETVVVEFEPPEKLRPAEIGVLMDQRADTLDITATIIDLANRGFLTIKEEQKKWVFGSSDYVLTKQAKSDTQLLDYEKELLDRLFEDADEVSLSSLKNKFYKDLDIVKNKLYQQVTDKKYFPENPSSIRTRYLLISIGIIVLASAGFWLGFQSEFALILATSGGLFTAGLLALILAQSMSRRTAVGHELYLRSLGYKMFIERAEKYRQQFFEHKNLFNEVLPYAIVFGATKKFADAFAKLGIEPQQPSWYSGVNAFNYYIFATSINNFSTSFSQAIASTPSSSGSGGGGFSGGGFGGGGGGSW